MTLLSYIFSYIFWNASPEIFTIPIPFLDTQITLRWYGLLFALGFLISQQILYYIFKKEGKPEKDVDTLTIYMVVSTIIGARLGHVLFYEPDRYLSNPIDILKIWEGGLASHGAAIGILFALWLYARKKNPGQNYLQTLDRIVILVALTGALIRFGNFFNSEIIGKPTNSESGVVFVRHVSEVLQSDGVVEKVSYLPNDSASVSPQGFVPITLLLEFKKGYAQTKEEHEQYMDSRINSLLMRSPYINEHIDQPDYITYKLTSDANGQFFAIVYTHAIARYPAQLFEAISCVLLFIWLFWIWNKHKNNLPDGRIFGVFMIVLWTLRFAYEFLKENQVEFENSLPLNMGQLLSIPMVLVGIYILVRSYQQQKAAAK